MRTDPSLAESIIKLALSLGAQEVEVLQQTGSSRSFDIKEGKVEAVERSSGFGYGIRVVTDGRLGFSYSNDPSAAPHVCRSAVESSRHTFSDEHLILPECPAPSTDVKCHDPEVEALDDARAIEFARSVEAGARQYDKRITKIRKAQARFSSSENMLSSSRFDHRSYAKTSCTASIMSIAEENGDGQMGWGFDTSPFLNSIDFASVGRDAARRAVSLLGAKNITPMKAPVLMDNMVVAEFLGVFASMLSGDELVKSKTLLKGRDGQKIISEDFDIVDDALMTGRPGTRPFDAEGMPSMTNLLVQGGVLKAFMHNSYTARRMGCSSTANASRGGYASIPSVGPSNFCLVAKGRTRDRDDIIASMDRGLLVLDAMGMHTVDPVSGNYSIGVSGLRIEGGRVAHPVKEAVISGNLLALFAGISEAADDMVFHGGIGAPSLLFEPLDISA